MKNKIRFFRWLSLIGLIVVLFTISCAPVQDSQVKEAVTKQTITLGENSWTTSELNIAVAKILIEDEMGYPVEVATVSGDEMFPAMEEGTIHAVLEVWPSARSGEIQEYTEKGAVEVGGELGVVGIQGWFMPAYVLDDHPELATWKGFKDEEVAALFSTPKSGVLGQLLLGDPTWVYLGTDFIETQGLPLQAVYAGSEDAILSALDIAYSNNEPVLFYLWTPHTAFAKYQLVEVELPKYTQECADKADAGQGRECGYPPDVLLKVISSSLNDFAPEVYRLLKNFRYTNEDQIMMLGLVDIQGKTVEEAARIWVDQNESIWKAWIP